MLLELIHDLQQIFVRFFPHFGFFFRHVFEVFRGTNPGHHIFALRVDQVFTHRVAVAGSAIAGERHAGSGFLTHVSEDHGANVHGRTEQAGDLVDLTVFFSALRVPRTKYGTDGEVELQHRILREGLFDLLEVNLFVDINEFFELFSREIGIFGGFIFFLQLFEFFFEVLMGQAAGRAHDHIPEHIDEAAVAVPCGALVAGLLNKTVHGLVGQAEIENRVHHSRHRNGRTRTNGNEKRVIGVAKLFAFELFEFGEGLFELKIHPLGIFSAVFAVDRAGFRRNGKAGGNRQIGVRHFSQIGSLAAENGLHCGIAFGVFLTVSIEIDILFILRHRVSPWFLLLKFSKHLLRFSSQKKRCHASRACGGVKPHRSL